MEVINIATREKQNEILSKLDLALPPVLEEDPTNSPGPKRLSAGTLEYGYFGLVEHNELIAGNALASDVGISQGTAQNNEAGWLKFALDQKILFVASKTFRHSISWDHINTAGAVFGTKTVAIGGKTYKVRLLTGGNAAPASSAGGEWNKLMYAVHFNEWPRWESFTDGFLLTHSDYGRGSYSWCQETSASSSAYRVLRGYSGVAYFNTYTSSNSDAHHGWRPCLELVN